MPLLVHEYNKFMGGCDQNDQMTRLNKSRKHYWWPCGLFIKFIILFTFYNAYIIKSFYETGTKRKSFKQFTKSLFYPRLGFSQMILDVYPKVPEDTSTSHLCVVCNCTTNIQEKPLASSQRFTNKKRESNHPLLLLGILPLCQKRLNLLEGLALKSGILTLTQGKSICDNRCLFISDYKT